MGTSVGGSDLARKVSASLGYNLMRVAVSAITSFMFSIIVVRWLRVNNFGLLTFLGTFFAVYGVLYDLAIDLALARFIPELRARGDHARLRRISRYSFRLGLFSAFLGWIIIFTLADVIAMSWGNPNLALFIQLLSLKAIPGMAVGLFRNLLISVYDQKFLAISNIGLSITTLATIVLFVVVLDLGIFGVIVESVLNMVLVLILYSLRVWLRHRHLLLGETAPLGVDLRRRIIRYVIPLIVLNLTNFLLWKPSANLFLGFYRNYSEVAYFDVPFSFIQAVLGQIVAVVGGLGLASLVDLRALAPSRVKSALTQYTKLSALYVIPIAVGGFILAEPILTILYGQQLQPAVLPMRILLVAYSPLNILFLSTSVLLVHEQTFFILKLGTVSSAILIALNFLLVPQYGFMGASITQSIVLVFTATLLTWKLMSRLDYGNFLPLVSMGKYFMAALIMGLSVYLWNALMPPNGILSLLSLVTLGLIIYIASLKLLRAFSEADKRLILKTNLPFRHFLARFF